ncbi:MAG TPA: S1 RNA-binding domain-containing protein [Myxococcota bacterium]|nr:S1 RNA-binding domain-containing protein [Myxococcota bacterium]
MADTKADTNETPETPTTADNRGEKGRGKGRGPGRKPREAQAEPQIEVIARGKGKRETGDAITVGTVSAGPVTVEEDLDFAALMAGEPDKKGEDNPFGRGKRVKGVVEVISTAGPEIFLDLGDKATGYVLKEDVRDSDGNIVVKPGDVIEGIVYGEDDNGIRIRVRLGQDADLRSIKVAQEGNIPVEGKVIGHNKGGYEVKVANVRAFCPHSQIDLVRVEDPETMIGQNFTFRVVEIKDNGGVVLSRAALLKEERGARGAELMSRLGVGARMKGRVRSIQKFGVFVDLGGKDGLVHISELSWSRVDDPHTVVKLGDEVEVVVTEVDLEKDKIGLSMRQAQADPIEELGAKLQVGEIVTGRVARLKDFGAFIELADNVEGLVHISDLAHYRVKHPKDILKVGETVRVKVLEVLLDRRQIKLSLKALAADPWEAVAERYPVGKTVTGRVDSVVDFGVFVSLEPGVNALLPASESKSEGQPLAVAFKVGKDVEARIMRVDLAEKKIALTRRDEEEIRARPPRDGGGPRGNRSDRMAELGITPKGGADWSQRPRNDRGDRHDRGGFDRGDRGGSRGPTLAYTDTPDKADAPMSAMAAEAAISIRARPLSAASTRSSTSSTG